MDSDVNINNNLMAHSYLPEVWQTPLCFYNILDLYFHI